MTAIRSRRFIQYTWGLTVGRATPDAGFSVMWTVLGKPYACGHWCVRVPWANDQTREQCCTCIPEPHSACHVCAYRATHAS